MNDTERTPEQHQAERAADERDAAAVTGFLRAVLADGPRPSVRRSPRPKSHPQPNGHTTGRLVLALKTCANAKCGRPFAPRSGRQKWCGPKCRKGKS